MLNVQLVTLRHLIVNISHETGVVVFLIGHFSQHLHEWWNRDLLRLTCALDSQNAWTAIDISEGLHHEVLPLEDEALSDLPDLFLGGVL